MYSICDDGDCALSAATGDTTESGSELETHCTIGYYYLKNY